MNDENMRANFSWIGDALMGLGLVSWLLMAIGAAMFWGVPFVVIKRVKLRAQREGREPEDHWNTFLPYAKELTGTEKALLVLNFIVAFSIIAIGGVLSR